VHQSMSDTDLLRADVNIVLAPLLAVRSESHAEIIHVISHDLAHVWLEWVDCRFSSYELCVEVAAMILGYDDIYYESRVRQQKAAMLLAGPKGFDGYLTASETEYVYNRIREMDKCPRVAA
jgi:hypothetical protein